jgi:hypothetical protein
VLDQVPPAYEVRDYHEVAVGASPEAALAAALEPPRLSERETFSA